ncbi:STAS domain-containing protein [Spirillospora sp. NBC_00431]
MTPQHHSAQSSGTGPSTGRGTGPVDPRTPDRGPRALDRGSTLPSGGAWPETGLTRERLSDHTVIAISGELDIASIPSLRERLYVALRDPGMYVIIDLSGVTSCDASGLAMLVGARRRMEAKGTALILARPRPQTAGLLRATGLLHAFAVRPSGAGERATGADARSAAA